MSVIAVLLVAGPAPGLPAPARGGVPSELIKEFHAGVDAYRLGKYDEASLHLSRAQALDPRLPGPHRFLAAVARAKQRWADCIAETRRAIELNPRSQEIAETRRLHNDCRAALGRPPYRTELGNAGAIMVTANRPGAAVRIGGLRYGVTPVGPRRITPGVHELDVNLPGWKPAHRAFDALPGIVTDIDVELEPAVEPAPAERPPPRRERGKPSVH